MPTFIPLPNGVVVCFDLITAGQNWQFCLGLRLPGGAPTPSDLTAIASAASSWATASLMPQLHNSSAMRQVRATDFTVQGGPQAIVLNTTAGGQVGTSVTNGQPAVVSIRTAKRGRSYRGRVYISGLPDNSKVSAVDMSAAAGTAMSGIFATLDAALLALTNSVEVGVWSRQHNGVVTTPGQFNRAIAYVTDTHYDSQRRRLAGRGT